MAAGPTHPDFTMLTSIARGYGKTVLLTAMRDAAESRGWVTASVTATPRDTLAGMIVEEMEYALRRFDSRRQRERRRRVDSFGVSALGTSVLGTGVSLGLSDRPEVAGLSSEPPVHTRMLEQVIKPMWSDLSDTDKKVLIAISRFRGAEIRRCDLVRVMGKSSGYVSTYLTRLTNAGIIFRPTRGRLSFVHEAMGDWVRRQRLD